MKFGDTPLARAKGAILAHSLLVNGKTFKKGKVLEGTDIAFLWENGITSVVAARLGKNDLNENQAAERLARAMLTDGLRISTARTGRCNLLARSPGLIRIDRRIIDRINRRNEAITVATVQPDAALDTGDIAATAKIITFGVSQSQIAACEKIIGKTPPLSFHPFQRKRIGLIQTTLSGTRNNVIEKSTRVTKERVRALGSDFTGEIICAHEEKAIAGAIEAMAADRIDILLILGASAISDRRDVVPQGLIAAGGTIEHFGMPVDPGNLMLLAHRGDMHVLGIPGSARSPRLHGFDWVLQRLTAGIEVTARDITSMGVGGLLKEIPGRPMPRLSGEKPKTESGRNIAALILAAGQSRRMGERNKMLVEIDGVPMVRRVASAIAATNADPVVVVSGHQRDKLEEALEGIDVSFAHNPSYADGLSTSLKAGMGALPADAVGVIVCLGDMPGITPEHLDALIEAFDPDNGKLICVPTRRGKRGNPVLWHRRFFDTIANVSGDVGARHLIGEHSDYVAEVPMEDDAVLTDLDTPAALDAYLQHKDD